MAVNSINQNWLQTLLLELGIPVEEDIMQYSKLTGSDISKRMRAHYGIGEELPAGAFSPISEDLLKQLQWKTYTPLLEAKQAPLEQSYISSMTGPKMEKVMSGIRDVGARDGSGKVMKDKYRTDTASSIFDIQKLITSSEETIRKDVQRWRDMAMSWMG